MNKDKQINDDDQITNEQFEELFVSVGKQGKYQSNILILFYIIIFGTGLVTYAQTYIWIEPNFFCINDNDEHEICHQQQACSNKKFRTVSKISNIITQYELYCDKSNESLQYQAFISIIGAVIAFSCTFLADFIGRSQAFINAFFCSVIGCCLFLFAPTIGLNVLGLTLLVGFGRFAGNWAQVYSSETMNDYLINKTTSFNFLLAAVSSSTMLLLYNYVSHHFYSTFILIQIVIGLGLFYIKETPYYLFKSKNYIPLKKLMMNISNQNNDIKIHNQNITKINQLIPDTKPIQINILTKIKQKFQLLDRKTLKKLSSLLFLSIELYLVDSIFILGPQYLGGNNISFNITLANFGDLLGYLFMGKFGSNFNQKKMFKQAQIACFFVGLILFMIYLLGLRNNYYIILLEQSQIFIYKFLSAICFCCFFNLCLSYFESQIKGFAIGLLKSISQACQFMGPFLIKYQRSLGLNPLTIIIILSLLSVYLSNKVLI